MSTKAKIFSVIVFLVLLFASADFERTFDYIFGLVIAFFVIVIFIQFEKLSKLD